MKEAIRIENLVQKARGKTILDDVSLGIQAGECFGLFGNKGAGKTSLLNIIAGIDRFSSGMVSVLGCDVRKSEGFKKELGYVTQEPSLFRDLSGEENLDFIASLKGVDARSARATVERLELEGQLKERAGKLEPGVYKRLSLACAMLGNPRVLLVDDLDSELDLPSLELILKELRLFHSQGGTCIIASGKPEFFGLVDRVGWLEMGTMSLWDPGSLQVEWETRLHKVLDRSGSYDG